MLLIQILNYMLFSFQFVYDRNFVPPPGNQISVKWR